MFPTMTTDAIVTQVYTTNMTYNIEGNNDTGINVTNHTHFLQNAFQRDEQLAKVEVALQGVLLYLALFGNLVVLLVLKCRQVKMTRMQWFIVHLCLADISVALFNTLPQMAWDITFRFQGSNFTCKIVKYLQLTAMFSSSYVLVMTALDRYMSICYPLASQTWTTRRVHIMISLAWALSLVFSIPQLVLFSMQEVSPGSGVYDCWESLSDGPIWRLQIYITWIFLSIYAIPLLVLGFVYSRICYVVWVSVDSGKTHTRKRSTGKSWKISFRQNTSVKESDMSSPHLLKNPRAHRKGVSKSKIKTIKLTLVVVTSYIVCWGPFFVAQMWSVYDMTIMINNTAMVLIVLLANLNSCVNPWIFLAFSSQMCKTRPQKVSRFSALTVHTFMDSESRLRQPLRESSSGQNFSKLEPHENCFLPECDQSKL